MRKPLPNSIQCRWCLGTFEDGWELGPHKAECPVKMKVQQAERQAGRMFRWEEIMAVRDRARKEVAMDKQFQDLKH